MAFQFLKQVKFHTWAAVLITGFISAALYTILLGISRGNLFTAQEFAAGVSLPNFLLVAIACSFVITVLMILAENPYPAYIVLFAAAFVCTCTMGLVVGMENFSVSGEVNIAFMLGIGLIMLLVLKYLMADDKLMLVRLCKTRFLTSWKCMYGATSVAVVLFIFLVSFVSIHRYLTFSSNTFDFSLFAQMFEQMKHTGLPVTTLERGEQLSHFAVHFSPSWYLLLPGYMVFSTPIYLYIANAVILALGAFPVFRIAKKLGMSPCVSSLFSMIYLLYPTMAAGTLWDIHENSLLPVLILYMVYFFLEEKNIPMFLFAVLILGTKEDAAIYVIAFGLYVVFAGKRKHIGAALVLVSVLYFLFAIYFVTSFGGEAMTGRYSNMYTEGMEGFAGIAKTCITNIGYLIEQAVSLEDGKLQFILWMLVPVLFAPFLSKKNSLLFLLIPMLVINLMSGWVYQYNVYYQYTYGPAALIVLASMFAYTEWKREKRRFFIVASFVLCFLFSSVLFWSKGTRYLEWYSSNKQEYKDSAACIEDFLDVYYSEGDSVTAQGFLTSHLSEIDELYTLPAQYSSRKDTDWYLLSEKYQNEEDYPADILEQYECVNPEAPGFVRIYKKK